MSLAFNLYPVLTEELIHKIGYEVSNYKFAYSHEEKIRPLAALPPDGQEHRSDILYLKDDAGIWAHDEHDIILHRRITLNVPRFLFGSNGIACLDAELGLALRWTSKSSNQTGVIQIGSISAESRTESYILGHNFPVGMLRGKIGLETVLYLIKTGNPRAGERHLAKDSGVVLGKLDNTALIIDGSGSIFPIVETHEAGSPLWWVNCNWSDPCTDGFDEENVRICLNRAHKDFQTLKPSDNDKWSPMLKDVLASAMHIIIQKAKSSEQWEEIESGQSVEPGSIGHVLYYSLNTFKWDSSSPERLAKSIRLDLDRRIASEMIS